MGSGEENSVWSLKTWIHVPVMEPTPVAVDESRTWPRFPSVKWTHLRNGALTSLPVLKPGLCGSNLMEKLTA